MDGCSDGRDRGLRGCESVYPDFHSLTTNQLGEQIGGASLRHVTPTHPTSEFRREPSFVKLVFASNGEQPEPQYRKVLDGKDSQRKETDIDVADELPSVPTAKYFDEKIQLDGVYSQDSNELDSDISAQGSQLSSLTYPLFDARSSEEINQVATPINGEETEVKSQLSIAEETDANIKTVAPTDCEDQSGKTSFFHAASKTVQATVKPTKCKQQDVAKVLYRSDDWKPKFPLDELVVVKCDKTMYHRKITDSKGCSKILVYKKVSQVDHELFKKWKELDGNSQCDSVVAYLEDESFGYIVKEYLENVNKIIDRLDTITEDLTKFHKSVCHQTADSMSWWSKKRKEQKKLIQLLNNLVTGLINANKFLHQLGFVSLNIHLNNLFARFNCDCWDSPTCVHGSSAVTVVIGYCELAHPVESMVNGPTQSKALKLLDPLHKYKRAEAIYDNLDVINFIVKLLTKISGNKDCRKKMNLWTCNIANAIYVDPPVEEVQQLLENCDIPTNDTSIIINYLKVAAAHYSRLHGEHEV